MKRVVESLGPHRSRSVRIELKEMLTSFFSLYILVRYPPLCSGYNQFAAIHLQGIVDRCSSSPGYVMAGDSSCVRPTLRSSLFPPFQIHQHPILLNLGRGICGGGSSRSSLASFRRLTVDEPALTPPFFCFQPLPLFRSTPEALLLPMSSTLDLAPTELPSLGPSLRLTRRGREPSSLQLSSEGRSVPSENKLALCRPGMRSNA